MLDNNVTDVPKHKGHRTASLRAALLGLIPAVSIAVDTASSVAIDSYPFARKNEACPVVLKDNGVPVVSPV